MKNALPAALFLPLLSSLVLMFFGNRFKRNTVSWIACTSLFFSFLLFTALFVFWIQSGGLPEKTTLYQWIPVRGIEADFTLYLDTLSLLMALVITGVGFLIHVYSVGYTDHEKDYGRFFACLNFFVFSMLLLILGGHLLVLFLGWEGVGLASYLLIGYWYDRKSAAEASAKAFVVNRVGDFGFLIGVLLVFTLFGTGDIQSILGRANEVLGSGSSLTILLTLLFFWGAVGKSAQLPLHTWLPDAMEGPTPVSALIHAATMVTAGVYLVVRLNPIYSLAPETLMVIGTIGAITALYAALTAVGQTDLKRVLAYSTVSQLGYMFLACGVGAYFAAMFHLTMHAFVKALLFLSAGNVVHMLHGETEMKNMGGLRKIFTKTHWLFLIGVLALSGIPPLAAFFSKEEILAQGYHAGFTVLYLIGLFTGALTAFYLTRAYCLAFVKEKKEGNPLPAGVVEAPSIMLWPVSILAVLSIIGGGIGFSFGHTSLLGSFLEASHIQNSGPEENLFLDPMTYLAIFGAVFGVIVAFSVYIWMGVGTVGIGFLKSGFYVDWIYEKAIVQPLRGISLFITRVLEPRVFSGSLDVAALGVGTSAKILQRFQSGQIRSYVAWIVFGSVLLIVYFAYQEA